MTRKKSRAAGLLLAPAASAAGRLRQVSRRHEQRRGHAAHHHHARGGPHPARLLLLRPVQCQQHDGAGRLDRARPRRRAALLQWLCRRRLQRLMSSTTAACPTTATNCFPSSPTCRRRSRSAGRSTSPPSPTRGNTIQFQIALSQLATSAMPVANIQNLEINFVATNVVPVAERQSSQQRLRRARQPVHQRRERLHHDHGPDHAAHHHQREQRRARKRPAMSPRPTATGLQPVSDPDLDIVDYTIEVRD